MLPLEKVALAVRIAGFPKFATAYVRACGEEAPETWDLANAVTHLGTKLAAQALVEGEVRAGVSAAREFNDVKVASQDVSFTSEFHAVNRLASGLDKTASAEALSGLTARRLALWGSMKAAAEREPDVLTGLAKIALRVWSETSRSGEKTASTRAEREAYALSFAANYLVDTKIASAYEAKELSLVDAIKLSHLSAEAALEDLAGVVKVAGVSAPWLKAVEAEHEARKKSGEKPSDMAIPGVGEFKHLFGNTYQAKKVAAEKIALNPRLIDPRLIGAGVGAVGGAAVGAASDKDNRWRGAGMGALMGMPVGALGGQIAREIGQNAAAGAEKARRGQEAFDKLKIYAGRMGAAGNNLPAVLDKNKDSLVSAFGDGKRVIPNALMEALDPNDFEQLLKLDRSYGGAVFGKTSMYGAAPQGQTGAPGGAPGGQGVPLNPEAVRKGAAGYQQLVSYGQTIGNGLPELIEQNKDAIVQHFAEGNKHMPPQITAAMGPGIIDQVLQLKKQFQAPVI